MTRSLRERFGLGRVEAALLALMIALPVGGLLLGDAVAHADDDEGEEEEHGRRAAPVADTPAMQAARAAWQEECGSCHVAYPPRLMWSEGWRITMRNLGDHFGTDASIDDKAVAAQIAVFLEKSAGMSTRVAPADASVPRVTETPWFVREHDEVAADVWKRPSIKSAANCGACHQAAADGNYSERGIRIPKQ